MANRAELAHAIRFLAMDAVQKANSGHPGMPMGMADIAEVLWNDFLKHNPKNPDWLNRDRFVLSNGHGSMLLYALLHLSGYDLSIEDLKQFRQLHSRTPGHPEYGFTPGVETTTGPLGQGLANAVGMAIAEKHLAAQFNKNHFNIIDHYTYCFVGDGCLMEGISHEVCSLAGTLGLGKLIVFYDDNGISIDGSVENWFRDDTPKRFESYGWQVIADVDGHDAKAIKNAIETAKENKDQPTLICCKTVIGWGSPNLAGTHHTHGAPLGVKEIESIREKLNWSHESFVIAPEIYKAWDASKKGFQAEEQWQLQFSEYQSAFPKLADDLMRRYRKALPSSFDFEAFIQDLQSQNKTLATRKASKLCLDHLSELLPELFGGSADLSESNGTLWKNADIFTRLTPNGRYLHYGVREFGMSAMMNGIALHGGLIPFGGTFLTFSDYARNALRLAAFMRIRSIFVYTHDSIGLGEDGPTHQPIEHLPSLRLIPELFVWRPCDTVETAVAWEMALQAEGPSCLLLSRQDLMGHARNETQLKNIRKGAYVLYDLSEGDPDVLFLATGSEVGLAYQAALKLKEEHISVRVVSMPSVDQFLQQDLDYQQSVIPPHIKNRIAIEAAASNFWYQFVGDHGAVIGMNRYGASAPASELFKEYGFTVENVVMMAKKLIGPTSNEAISF